MKKWTVYPYQGSSNKWLRIIPRTKFGAFARGAKVTVFTSQSGVHTRIIDGGSGYLCEMEPVAHFGLGNFFLSLRETSMGGKWDTYEQGFQHFLKHFQIFLPNISIFAHVNVSRLTFLKQDNQNCLSEVFQKLWTATKAHFSVQEHM